MKFWDKGFFIFDQVKKGNIKAFESLFKESYQELCNYSYGFVKDNDVAEEIVQDFFFNFWKNRKTTNINTSLNSYMHTAVKNMSLNFIEKQKVRQRYKDQVQADGPNLQMVQPEDDFNLKELQAQVNEVLKELSPRCQKVFKMSRYEGFTNAQIAEKLSVSIKTVEADITTALKLLRAKLASLNNS